MLFVPFVVHSVWVLRELARRRRLAQSRNVFGAGDDLHAGARQVAAERFGLPAQASRQERLGDGVEGEVILRPGEAVPLIRIQQVRDGDVPLLHGPDDLVGLGLLNARVVLALPDQKRAADALDVMQRRLLLQHRKALGRARVANAVDQPARSSASSTAESCR